MRVRGEHSAAALFIAADSLFEAFPRARLLVDQVPAVLDDDPRVSVETDDIDARVVWETPRPVVVLDKTWIVEAVRHLGAGSVGSAELIDADGSSLGVLRSRRARRRAARWGTESGFETARMPADGIHALRADPRVEAWVGGWGGVESFCAIADAGAF